MTRKIVGRPDIYQKLHFLSKLNCLILCKNREQQYVKIMFFLNHCCRVLCHFCFSIDQHLLMTLPKKTWRLAHQLYPKPICKPSSLHPNKSLFSFSSFLQLGAFKWVYQEIYRFSLDLHLHSASTLLLDTAQTDHRHHQPSRWLRRHWGPWKHYKIIWPNHT